MRLNHDCIRDILLYIEDGTDTNKPFLNFKSLSDDLNYDDNTLIYHIMKLDSADLIENVFYADDTVQAVSSLSWDGHAYVDNIRDSKVWSGIKKATETVTSIGLPVMIQVAEHYLQTKLGLK